MFKASLLNCNISPTKTIDSVAKITISLFYSILHYNDSPTNYKLSYIIKYWQI